MLTPINVVRKSHSYLMKMIPTKIRTETITITKTNPTIRPIFVGVVDLLVGLTAAA